LDLNEELVVRARTELDHFVVALPQWTPSYGALDGECRILLEELARLIEERTARLEVEGPRLEARWLLAVGGHHLRVLQAECAVRRLRRKTELLRAAIYRAEALDLTVVESRLDAEMARWEASIQEEAHRLQLAREWVSAPLLSLTETQELRRLFRQLARSCHPDANPSGGPRAEEFWLRASRAYAAGDLDELRALALLADVLPESLAAADGIRERRDALKTAVLRMIDEIAALDSQYPFTLRARLEDEAGLAWERDALQQKLATLADECLLLETVVAHLLEEPEDV
jgi:hypothetical protein